MDQNNRSPRSYKVVVIGDDCSHNVGNSPVLTPKKLSNSTSLSTLSIKTELLLSFISGTYPKDATAVPKTGFLGE